RAHRAATALAEARTCYDHLAGRRGVQLHDRLLASAVLVPLTEHDERDHRLTANGARLITELGVDLDRLTHTRRIFARRCIDWTRRRPHLAGALPAAIPDRLLSLGWLRRGTGRDLRVAEDYDRRLDDWLG